jgi:glucose-6-phosphate isomerase
MSALTESPAWKALAEHQRRMADVHMRDLFAADPERFARFSLRFRDILFDYSKNRITGETLDLLLAVAEAANLRAHIRAMFRGDPLNVTEHRPALHVALRNRGGEPIGVEGKDVMPDVNRVLEQMRAFSAAVRSGAWTGYTGKRITDIVNIGIGGSDLGPKMATLALAPYAQPGLRVDFVANVDGTDIADALQRLYPETALFLIASKTFETKETMQNARTARDWFLKRGGHEAAIAQHFVAISTDTEKVRAFGIDPAGMFEFWDWVGGRYSVWSAIGLSLSLYIGFDHFLDFLAGAHAADEHFRTAPLASNIPVIMGLLGIWYNNFWGAQSHAILPYDQSLEHLASYFQQVDMESNGKRVTGEGQEVDYQTGPIVWGQPGTNGQHSFYQLLHQGTKLVPCDFLVAAQSHNPLFDHHSELLANFFAQSEALMAGTDEAQLRAALTQRGLEGRELERQLAARTCPGNQPTNSVLFQRLTPAALGALIAMYEHKVFVQGVVWGINSFDQMGVELGKRLAERILPELADDQPVTGHDSSTNGLINYCKRIRC